MQIGFAESWWNMDASIDLYSPTGTSFILELLLNSRKMETFI
jgi:hypothetical protein